MLIMFKKKKMAFGPTEAEPTGMLIAKPSSMWVFSGAGTSQGNTVDIYQMPSASASTSVQWTSSRQELLTDSKALLLTDIWSATQKCLRQ